MSKNETKDKVMEIFRIYVKDTFHQPIETLNIVIYGVELQICGGLLKYLDKSIHITLVSYDLRSVENIYEGYRCCLPEMCMPYPENTVVLCSILYEYQYKEIAAKLEKLGIKKTNIVWAHKLSEILLGETATYFAAKGMDEKVRELFERSGKNISHIRYLDIGANNYSFYNNSYLFYRAGASGVLVEANPDFADTLKTNRIRDTVLMYGCSGYADGSMTYYKTNRAGYNTFVSERAKKIDGKNGVKIIEEISVPVRSINSIIKENFSDGHIDYLSVDIEGMGAEVVGAIDFSRFDIDIILIEMDYDSDASRECYTKLHSYNYAMISKGIGGDKDFLFYKKSVFI